MSRAMNVTVARADVEALCAKHKVSISAIETLLSGGTRLVLNTVEEAAVMQRALRTKMIAGPVTRTRWVRNH